MKVAIPHHGGEVTPCFEYTAGIKIYSVRKNRVIAQTDFTLQSKEELDRVRLLRDQAVRVLICSGIQAAHEGLLLASGIRVISWVSGKVSEVLRLFLQNKLVPGSARLGAQGDGSATASEEGITDS
jgi:predicted Fe-Mo cluster-binding NifX family protein